MKRARIKIPNLPVHIRRMDNGMYYDSKTGRWHSVHALQRMFGTEPETQPKQEAEHWTNNYYGNS